MSSFREQLTGYRAAAGSWDGGFYDPGDSVEFSFYASIQPLTPDEMQALPEGRRTLQAYNLFTDYLLQTGEAEDQMPDCVVIDGEHYEVISVARWRTTRLAHYEVIVARPVSDEHS